MLFLLPHRTRLCGGLTSSQMHGPLFGAHHLAEQCSAQARSQAVSCLVRADGDGVSGVGVGGTCGDGSRLGGGASARGLGVTHGGDPPHWPQVRAQRRWNQANSHEASRLLRPPCCSRAAQSDPTSLHADSSSERTLSSIVLHGVAEGNASAGGAGGRGGHALQSNRNPPMCERRRAYAAST